MTIEEGKDLGTPPPEIEKERLVGEALTASSARRKEFFGSDNPLAGYLKKKWGSGVVEMTDQRRRQRHKRKAERLVGTLLSGQTPSGKAISDLSKRYQRDLRLTAEATGLSFPGVGEKKSEPVLESVVIAEEPKRVVVPEIAPEETRGGASMMPPMEEKAGEKAAIILEGKVSWRDLSGKTKGLLSELVKKTGAPELVEAVKSIGMSLSKEEIEGVQAAQKERGRAREKAVKEALEVCKAKVLASPEAVRDWVAGQWEKVSAPLTKEESKAALEAQRFKMPDLKKLSPKELSERLKAMDPATRRKVAITLGITAAVGVTALGCYEIVGRHGKEFQMVAQYFSGLSQAGRELVARATEAIPTATGEIPTAIPTGTPVPSVTAVPPSPFPPPSSISVPPVSPGIPATPRGVERAIPSPLSLEKQIKAALMAKKVAIQVAAAQVKQLAQTGVEIVRGGSVWQASGNAAGQILEASGVQSDPKRLIILTDAIKDIAKEGGLGDVVQPGTMLKVNPDVLADHLRTTVENIKSVQAVGGTLEVPADQADLTALTKVAKFLGGF